MGYKKVKLGNFAEIEEIVKKMNQEAQGKKIYSLAKAEGKNNFWILKEEDQDDINCGILELKGDIFYAVSEEVFDFLTSCFSKVVK